MSNADIRFELNAYGKPRLSGADNYHFNVSHAGEWVVCMVDSEPVGVDVEHVKAMDITMARSFFAEEEYRYVMESAQSKEQMQRFYHIWTAKESYIKAVGKGLSLPLQEFSVLTAEGVEGAKKLGGEAWQLQSYDLHTEDYKLTACFKPTMEIHEVERVNVNRILATLRSVNH